MRVRFECYCPDFSLRRIFTQAFECCVFDLRSQYFFPCIEFQSSRKFVNCSSYGFFDSCIKGGLCPLKFEFRAAFQQMFPDKELGPCAGPVVVELNPDYVIQHLGEQIRVDVVYGKTGESSVDESSTQLGRLLEKPLPYRRPAPVYGPADSCA